MTEEALHRHLGPTSSTRKPDDRFPRDPDKPPSQPLGYEGRRTGAACWRASDACLASDQGQAREKLRKEIADHGPWRWSASPSGPVGVSNKPGASDHVTRTRFPYVSAFLGFTVFGGLMSGGPRPFAVDSVLGPDLLRDRRGQEESAYEKGTRDRILTVWDKCKQDRGGIMAMNVCWEFEPGFLLQQAVRKSLQSRRCGARAEGQIRTSAVLYDTCHAHMWREPVAANPGRGEGGRCRAGRWSWLEKLKGKDNSRCQSDRPSDGFAENEHNTSDAQSNSARVCSDFDTKLLRLAAETRCGVAHELVVCRSLCFWPQCLGREQPEQDLSGCAAAQVRPHD